MLETIHQSDEICSCGLAYIVDCKEYDGRTVFDGPSTDTVRFLHSVAYSSVILLVCIHVKSALGVPSLCAVYPFSTYG